MEEKEIKKDTNQLDELKNDKTEIKEKNDTENKYKQSKKAQLWQIIKFTLFSISAGAIQLLSFECLYNWIGWKVWWPCYLISIVLSVVWNFTFNRKFTFKSATNVPISMTLALLFYAPFIPASVFGGNALEGIGWNGTLVTVLMMVINFVLEFLWDKFVVFNAKVTDKILSIFKKKDKNADVLNEEK